MARMATDLATTQRSLSRPGPWLQLGGLRRLAIRHLDLPIGDLPAELDGFRILHISDLHLTARWHAGYERAIETIASLAVDVILCTGDIVEDKTTHIPARPQIRRLLPALKSRLGFFTILGNHDNFELGRELPDLGITVLNGERLEIAGGSLELIGTPGLHRVDLPDDFAARFAGPVRGGAADPDGAFSRPFPQASRNGAGHLPRRAHARRAGLPARAAGRSFGMIHSRRRFAAAATVAGRRITSSITDSAARPGRSGSFARLRSC